MKSEAELRTNGLRFLLLSDITTLLPAVAIFPTMIIAIPRSSSPVPSLNACLPTLIKITPEMPKMIVIIFFFVSLSSLLIIAATTAIINGCAP